jgi:two-component system OmpR family response regulator
MRILLLEDDPVLSKLVAAYLGLHFRIDHVATFEEAADYIEHYQYDIALLDRDINAMDIGMQLIAKIKEKAPETGVIIISAYDTITDKITGLNLGADDYLDKPFDNDELLARIYALSRRRQKAPTLTLEGLECNTLNKTLYYNNEQVILTRKESDLFFYLLQKRGLIVAREELLDALYVNPQNISSNTLDVTLGHVRKKLPFNLIKTVKTRGYLIE